MLKNCTRFKRMAAMTSCIKSEFGNWTSLPCEKTELRIDITLDCGQSFRWRETSRGIWTGVMKGCVWNLSQTDHELLYQVYPPKQTSVKGKRESTQKKSRKMDNIGDVEVNGFVESKQDEMFTYSEMLKNYFQLDLSLDTLYTQFCEKDENFKQKASRFKGVRLLRQEPVETLFSFICSSNNNITRISGMIDRMCQHFGEKIIQLNGVDYYAFPSVEKLASDDVEQTLRDLSFGYRAKYISESAKMVLSKGGAQYLNSLRFSDYETAKASLMELQGVGAKVADCICLMALDKSAAIPVDTHVKQIAERDYSLRLATKSCTGAVYNQIGEYFRNLWGPYAGWAQSVLFASDLKKFNDADSSKIEEAVDIKVDVKQKRKRKRQQT